MLLGTSIPANSCGGIHAEFGDTDYYFTKNEAGDLVCEVDNKTHASVLLNSGNFYPYDDDSFDEADEILSGARQLPAGENYSDLLGDSGKDLSNLSDSDLNEEGDYVVDENAPLIEGVNAAGDKPSRVRKQKPD